MRIRAETEDDRQAIADVTTAAFGQEDEAAIVDAVRASDGFVPELSLVAEEQGRIVGHILLSYFGLEGSETRLLELGPMSVAPDAQRTGVGSALVRWSLRVADARGEPLVLVLGHPEYYPRFGFRPASTLGLAAPDSEWPDEVFMVIPLSSYDPSIRGRVVFPPAFS